MENIRYGLGIFKWGFSEVYFFVCRPDGDNIEDDIKIINNWNQWIKHLENRYFNS